MNNMSHTIIIHKLKVKMDFSKIKKIKINNNLIFMINNIILTIIKITNPSLIRIVITIHMILIKNKFLKLKNNKIYNFIMSLNNNNFIKIKINLKIL
jgi:hypothetical protein